MPHLGCRRPRSTRTPLRRAGLRRDTGSNLSVLGSRRDAPDDPEHQASKPHASASRLKWRRAQPQPPPPTPLKDSPRTPPAGEARGSSARLLRRVPVRPLRPAGRAPRGRSPRDRPRSRARGYQWTRVDPAARAEGRRVGIHGGGGRGAGGTARTAPRPPRPRPPRPTGPVLGQRYPRGALPALGRRAGPGVAGPTVPDGNGTLLRGPTLCVFERLRVGRSSPSSA